MAQDADASLASRMFAAVGLSTGAGWACVAAAAASATFALTLPSAPRGADTVLDANKDKGTLVVVGGDRFPEAAALAAAAFAESPVYLYIFGHLRPDERQEALRFLFLRNMWIVRRDHPGALLGVVQAGDGPISSRPLSSFFMLKPSEHRIGLLDMVRYGLLWIVWKHGWKGAQNMVTASASGDRHFESALAVMGAPRRGTVVLERMVVRPDCQGRGVGTWGLGTALGLVCDAVGRPCVLSTQETRNVTFYGRLGFRVVAEDSDLGSHWWVMGRRAETAAAPKRRRKPMRE